MIAFYLFLLLVVMTADLICFEKAIDTVGLTKEEWESNKLRFYPLGGFSVYTKYCFNGR